MTITIRQAIPADAPTIADFNCRLARESEHKRLVPDIVLAGVAAALADPGHKGPYHVAEDSGQILGQLQNTFEWSDWRNGWIWWIQSVYVHPDARRRGVFSALYAHLLQRAKDQGDVVAIRLYVEEDNARAKKTYSRLGMGLSSYGVMEYAIPGRVQV